MKVKTIKETHRSWAESVMPKDAPAVQRQEMERAFYSGAFAVFSLQMEQIAALSDADAEKAMKAVSDELIDYFRLLGKIPGPHGAERS